MMFDEYTKNQIVLGKKTVARRVVRNNTRPAIPNTIHKLKIDRTPRCYGYIKIIDCHKENLKDITIFDALKEGFPSVNEYLKYFMKINNVKDVDCEVWVVEFEYLKDYKGD